MLENSIMYWLYKQVISYQRKTEIPQIKKGNEDNKAPKNDQLFARGFNVFNIIHPPSQIQLILILQNSHPICMFYFCFLEQCPDGRKAVKGGGKGSPFCYN